ncbi:MAG: hypothetical protein FJ190_10605 [Gammaproteobacteria bacterium]|nr:hypothetical protein [Gammaproteobacteria bacterium]
MSAILYTVAKDEEGNLIKANDAEKGISYFCVVCKAELILRKSGKTGKGTKRPHFAHHALTPNCTPEAALHYSFKYLLVNKIQQHITTNQPLPISWNCAFCGIEHSGNLIKKIKAVKAEHNLTVCRPDIALFDGKEKVFAVIEIVVTHKPEESVKNYYKENNIVLIQINLTSDKDLDNLENIVKQPSFVDTCYNPKCEVCGHFQQKKTMTIIEGPCWKCNNPMKVAYISGSLESIDVSSHLAPRSFNNEELKLAKSKGVNLKTQYSQTMRDSYVANSCAKCSAFVGEHYLFTQYISPACDGELPLEEIDIGYHCYHCEREKFENEENFYGELD